jgi:hypothetical protein
MEPTGRANARPMINSAKSGVGVTFAAGFRCAQSGCGTYFAPTGKSVSLLISCLGPFAKIFLFPPDPNQFTDSRRPVPQRGVSRSSRTRGGMRWTRAAPKTSALTCGRRSRVVLTPRRRRQVLREDARDDGDKQARSPGRARNKP